MSSASPDPSQNDATLMSRFLMTDTPEKLDKAKAHAARIISLGKLAEDYKAVERNPRVASGRRENDAEHSWHLGITAVDLATKSYPHLDIERIRAFAAVHDLIETEVGDVSTFDLTPVQLAEKERLEEEGMQRLLQRIEGVTKADLESYERQDTPEARFVRAVDKLLPITVTLTSGDMQSLDDYGVTSLEQLKEKHDIIQKRLEERFGKEFPDVIAIHGLLCHHLEELFKVELNKDKAVETQRGPIEIERKYLIDLKGLPPSINLSDPAIEREFLQQGYVGIGEDGSEARIRSFNNERFEITVKQPGSIERKEDTIKAISRELFEDMWRTIENRQINKVRYSILYKKWKIELDVYEGNLDGLVTAEVEFSKLDRHADARLEAKTFEPPEWFGKDISEDSRFKNQNLATINYIELQALLRTV